MVQSSLNEEQLVNELRRGSRQAFGELYSRYRDSLCSYFYSFVKDGDRAEDLVHETFFKIWTNIHTLNTTGSFRSWLFSIARHEVLHFLRDRKPFDELPEEISLEQEDALDVLINDEQSEMVDNLLNRLRPAYRELVMLRIEERLSYAEIAAVIGKSQSAVRVHLYRARKALAKLYTELYGENHEQ